MPQIYIVEDDSLSIRQAVHFLTKEFPDVEISVFTSPAFALQALEDLQARKITPPDLIILDLGFSNESGFEVLRYWKSSGSPIPVIVWTILDSTYQDLCRLFGVHAVVSKMDGPNALVAAITAARTPS
ncbi:MAG TPA: response regulator [Terriglobales bacterium]|nr:response regulator [Terriglobales bacterium]